MYKISIYHPLFIFIIALIICGQGIWSSSIYILDESKNATCAREMMESDNHIVPTFNYELRTDKPPLHYYFMTLSYKIFGVNEFAARFFSSVFGALTVLITFLFTKKWMGKRTAVLAALGLLCSTHFALQFHLAVPDPYLVFFTTLAGFCFIDGFASQNKIMTYLAYVSIGLGVLAKGPIAIALPGLAVLLFLLFFKRFNWKTILSFRPFSGLLLTVIVAAPWYILVGQMTNGEWLEGFFFSHNLDRFADPKEGHGGSVFVTLAFVTGGMLPYSVYVIQSYKFWWQDRRNDFLFFCGLFALVVVVFFAIADTKLPNYTVPAYPFLAILLGHYLHKVMAGKVKNWWFVISSVLLLAIILFAPVGIYFGLSADPLLKDLSSQAWWFSIVSIVGIAGASYLMIRQRKQMLVMASLGFIFLTSIAINILYPKIDKVNPVAHILPKIDQDKEIAHYQRFNASFAFYLKKPIPGMDSPEEVSAFFKNYPDGILISRSDVAEDLKDLDFLKKLYVKQDLFETKKTVVYIKDR